MKTKQSLNFDITYEANKITDFILKVYVDMGSEGAIIALSGGLDSAVTAQLLVNSLGTEHVKLVYMPEKDSKRIHGKHARSFAKHLGIPLKIKNITPVLRSMGSYRLLPISLSPGKWLRSKLVKFGKKHLIEGSSDEVLTIRLNSKANSWVSRGNAYGMAKHRARMICLYQMADIEKRMVVGAANLTEWMTGTFSKWGVDHCADIMPILHLYRTQVEQLAEFLEIPDYIRLKPADPDIMPGLDNKGNLLGGFHQTDKILIALEQGASIEELSTEFDPLIVKRINTLMHYSRHMRQSPYWLEDKQ